jgi:hypothetical protein
MILVKNCFALYTDPTDADLVPLSDVDVLIEDNRISRIDRDLALSGSQSVPFPVL